MTVPDLTGKTTSEAGFILAKEDLEIGEISEEYSNDYAEDTIIGQNPPSGEKVRRNTKVDLIVSKGIELVQVPDVIGKTSQEAAAIIGQKGLKVSATKENSSSVEEDRIIRMSPQPGTSVTKGSTVNIVISLGPEMLKVPNLDNMTEAEAINKLEGLGFKVKSEYEMTDVSGEDGKVIRQFPSSGKKAEKGSTVIVYIGEYITD